MEFKKFKDYLLEKIRPYIDYKHDYYKDLEIQKDSSKDEIKNAYRKLSMKYHPDRNKEKGAEENFKIIKLAYDILSDDEWKKSYDSNYSYSDTKSTASKTSTNNKTNKDAGKNKSFKIEEIHLEILNVLKKTKQNSIMPLEYILKMITKKAKFKEYKEEDKLFSVMNELYRNGYVKPSSIKDDATIYYYILDKGLDEIEKENSIADINVEDCDLFILDSLLSSNKTSPLTRNGIFEYLKNRNKINVKGLNSLGELNKCLLKLKKDLCIRGFFSDGKEYFYITEFGKKVVDSF